MEMTTTEAAREGAARAKLPAPVRSILESAHTDPGAPYEPDALAVLVKLRADDPAGWARFRESFNVTGGTLGILDRVTAPAANGDARQGEAVTFDDPVPWGDAVDGAALLDDIKAIVERYADMPAGGAVAATLWGLWTWTVEAFSVAPNLMLTAPERESGKSRVTELLSWFVRRAKPVSDASAAAIYRGIAKDRPTLLFDEAQSFLKRKGDDPIRGIILASFSRRFAYVERCEGDGNEVRRFDTYAAKALNGRNLARVDDMLTSRSVVIPMTRAAKRLPDLRVDRDPVGEDIRRQCRRWADDHAASLRAADPDMGARFGRAADVWRPLYAVADAAGGDWPALARFAADALAASAATVADGSTLGTMLLADVRAVFGDREAMQSESLDAALNALSERPWATLRPGDKPMTAQARGRMLAAYGIHTVEIERRKGYRRAQFEHAWAAYLSDNPGN